MRAIVPPPPALCFLFHEYTHRCVRRGVRAFAYTILIFAAVIRQLPRRSNCLRPNTSSSLSSRQSRLSSRRGPQPRAQSSTTTLDLHRWSRVQLGPRWAHRCESSLSEDDVHQRRTVLCLEAEPRKSTQIPCPSHSSSRTSRPHPLSVRSFLWRVDSLNRCENAIICTRTSVQAVHSARRVSPSG
ncbi:hypothetical protein DFH06DRAFT_375014 [Mycena polygramma]|nr:hypothetical protein DFH06DRAFT_375014 [Mycena polygramma]